MVGYLQWLSLHLDELPAILSSRFEDLRKKAREESKVQDRHRRLDEAVADMHIGLEMFFKYAVESGALTQEEADVHLKVGWETLNQGADAQTEMSQENDMSQIFIQAISDLDAQNRVYIANMSGKQPVLDREIIPQKRELIGWGPDDEGIYYILMKPAIKAVNELLRGQAENKSVIMGLLLDSLEQKGLLAKPPGKTPGKSRSFTKTISGKGRYVTPIKGDAFDLN
jgi:hypothetical protein